VLKAIASFGYDRIEVSNRNAVALEKTQTSGVVQVAFARIFGGCGIVRTL